MLEAGRGAQEPPKCECIWHSDVKRLRFLHSELANGRAQKFLYSVAFNLPYSVPPADIDPANYRRHVLNPRARTPKRLINTAWFGAAGAAPRGESLWAAGCYSAMLRPPPAAHSILN